MARLGIFDAELASLGWFDGEAFPEGWFDHDLIVMDRPVASVPVVGGDGSAHVSKSSTTKGLAKNRDADKRRRQALLDVVNPKLPEPAPANQGGEVAKPGTSPPPALLKGHAEELAVASALQAQAEDLALAAIAKARQRNEDDAIALLLLMS